MQPPESQTNTSAFPLLGSALGVILWVYGAGARADADLPRNLVLLIGDGMGLAQVNATRAQTVGPDGRLAMERLPVACLVKTHAADNLITDSAAASTALATGAKTRNGSIGIDAAGRAMTTLLEAAHARGKATGIIVTSTITHATPASFAAHVPRRTDEAAIAVQLARGPVDLLLGGGRSFFVPRNDPGSRRQDGLNVLQVARRRGFALASTRAELAAARPGRVLGLFALDAIEGADPQAPTLADLTRTALSRLSADPDGFVLVIEGSQIDWAGHDNDIAGVVAQTRAFDAAIEVVLEHASARNDTLVVVTADHETGGLTLLGRDSTGAVEVGWQTDRHTAIDVPLYASGPGSRSFGGVLDNTEVGRRLARVLGLGEFPRAR